MSSRIHNSAAVALAVAAWLALPLGARAQMPEEDDSQRIERLEEQVRQLTGQNEELQHRNRLLEEQVRQLQAGQAPAPSVAAVPPRGPAAPPVVAANPPPQQPQYQQPQYQQPSAQQPQYQPPPYQQQQYPQTATTAPIEQPQGSPRGGGRRGDAFDPTQNPNAPGAPRALGGGAMPIDPNTPVATPPVGPAPGGRGAGEPGAAALTTLPPTATPRDEFDLGVGYLERKDYALAEETMRNFVQKYPGDRLVADAQYWMGEAMFQRQRYRDAAEAFLGVTTKYETSAKAPEALLRLGQSLAALKEKEAACAAFGEVTRKYPHAAASVKQGVEREQKRIKC